ncbi:scopoletin glucosyltransferase [Phtheirospermum japonicum]|uniref:Scopoletin glucosyltransferase n=1 Tax=Phtheirospermum japonicum TaxID=374723 RepID=A0A830BEI6_9LAMI|nr:scopoletin glucosyltransferase [Phtheirospermum japonicum]
MSTPDSISKFIEALYLLQEPFEKILQELSPSCLISDTFLPWTNNSAAKLGIPRLVFHGTSCFALCAAEQMYLHKPYKTVVSDSAPFVVPDLPHEEKLVTEVLGTGVSVGSKMWGPVASEGVPREAVETAVRRVMAAEEMRSRAKCYKEMGRKAVEEGGSSCSGLDALIDELSNYVPPKKQDTN